MRTRLKLLSEFVQLLICTVDYKVKCLLRLQRQPKNYGSEAKLEQFEILIVWNIDYKSAKFDSIKKWLNFIASIKDEDLFHTCVLKYYF